MPLDISEMGFGPTRSLLELDEEPEVDEDFKEVGFSFNWSDEAPGGVALVLFTVTRLARDFVDVYLGRSEAKTSIGSMVAQSVRDQSKKKTVADIQMLDRGVCHVHLCPTYHLSMPYHQQNDFATQLLKLQEFADPDASWRLVILTSDSLGNFIGHPSPKEEVCLGRVLRSSHWPNDQLPALPALEQPNLIGGAAAAVLTRCEFSGLRCLLMISYVDSRYADSLSLSGFLCLFCDANMSELKRTMASPALAEARLAKLKATQDRDAVFI